jgi:hypothetical protein
MLGNAGNALQFIRNWNHGAWDIKHRVQWYEITNDPLDAAGHTVLERIGNLIFGYTAGAFQHGALGSIGAAASVASGLGLNLLYRLDGVAQCIQNPSCGSGFPTDLPFTGSSYGDDPADKALVTQGYYHYYYKDFAGNAGLAALGPLGVP